MLGDITGDSRGPNNGAAAILDRGNGDGDSQAGAVLPHAHRLVVVNALSAANARHDLRKFILSIRCKEQRDRLTHNLLSTIAIHALGRRIPTGNDALQIFAKDSVIRRLHNGGQVKKGLFCLLAFSDVVYVTLDDFVSIYLVEGTHELHVPPLPVFGVERHSLVTENIFLLQFLQGLQVGLQVPKQADSPQLLAQQLRACVAQQLCHERINIGNGARARIDHQYPVFGRFKETAIAMFRNPQSLLRSLPFRYLSFERVCLLLQQRNSTQALVRSGEPGVALGGDDPGVLLANLGELLLVHLPVKALHRIGTAEREGMGLAQIVPEFFQVDRRRPIPLCPEERDHFPKDSHMAPALRRSRDHAPNDLGEAPRLRRSIDHELRQHRGCIDGDVLAAHAGGRNFQPVLLQSFLKVFCVRLRGQNDDSIPHSQAGTDECAHRVHEERVSLTELDEMFRLPCLETRVNLFRCGCHALSPRLPCARCLFQIL